MEPERTLIVNMRRRADSASQTLLCGVPKSPFEVRQVSSTSVVCFYRLRWLNCTKICNNCQYIHAKMDVFYFRGWFRYYPRRPGPPVPCPPGTPGRSAGSVPAGHGLRSSFPDLAQIGPARAGPDVTPSCIFRAVESTVKSFKFMHKLHLFGVIAIDIYTNLVYNKIVPGVWPKGHRTK